MAEYERLAALRANLEELRARHREIDARLEGIDADAPLDQFTIQRMKKQKLAIKDEIQSLLTSMHPDIIA